RTDLPRDQRDHQQSVDVARREGVCPRDQPAIDRVGQLLPSRTRGPRVSGDRCPYADAAASMVVYEVQNPGPGHRALSGRAPVFPTGARPTGTTHTQPPVGQSVIQVREPDAGNPPVRFDERDVETEHGNATKAPSTERVGNRFAMPKPPRHVS